MEPYFFRQLSPSTQSLISEIEDHTSKPIKVITRPNIQRYSCEYTPMGWCILAPRTDRLNDGSMIHELLHIRRFIVENIPRLEVAPHRIDDQLFIANVGKLDNAIEHLSFVNTEIKLWPSRKGYWGKIMHRELRRLNSLATIGPNELGHTLLCLLLVRRAVPSKKLLRNWHEFLTKNELHFVVNRYLDRMMPAQNKIEIVSVLLEILNIPFDDVELF